MFCRNCGREIRSENTFCPYCGAKMDKEKEESKAYPTESFSLNDRRREIIALLFAAFVGIIILVIPLHGKAKFPNDEEINRILSAESISVVLEGGSGDSKAVDDMRIENISIQSITQGNEVVIVDCDIEMTNSEISVDANYDFYLSKVNKTWTVTGYEKNTVFDVKPLKPAQEPDFEVIEEKIKEFYPDMYGEYEYTLAGKVEVYGFPISWSLESKSSDLEKGETQFIYDYKINSYSAHIAGSLEYDYQFSDSGNWILSEVKKINEDIEWDLVGTWNFYLASWDYYVGVEILEMDMDNQVATIRKFGESIYNRGSGEAETIQLGFYEEEGSLYFDSFSVPALFSEHKIVLVAKTSDLFYKATLPLTGESYYVGIGRSGD